LRGSGKAAGSIEPRPGHFRAETRRWNFYANFPAPPSVWTNMRCRHIMRRLLRTPGFTAIAVITLALGIGANSAIFSVIEGVLLKPLPYSHPEELIGVWYHAPGVNIPDLNISPSLYITNRQNNHTLTDIGMWDQGRVSVTGLAEPEEVRCVWLTD